MEKKDLKPAGVFKYFEEICQVPRPSKKEMCIRDRFYVRRNYRSGRIHYWIMALPAKVLHNKRQPD